MALFFPMRPCGTNGQASGDPAFPISCTQAPVDGDGDGWDSDSDCNDSNPNINPGAAENCTNGHDDDCDGYADENDADCYETDDDDAADDDDVADDDAADDDTDDDASDDDESHIPQLNENPHLGIVCGCGTADVDPRAGVALVLIGGLICWVRRFAP